VSAITANWQPSASPQWILRAVAIAANDGMGCVLSLSGIASSATSISGTADVQLKGCDPQW